MLSGFWAGASRKPVRLVLTYREYTAGGGAAPDEGRSRELTEQDNTIARELGNVLAANGCRAHHRQMMTGWGLMYNLLFETKCHASRDGEIWLISANCPELIRAVPLLMRDPKNLDDVLKTDKGTAKVEQDVPDAAGRGSYFRHCSGHRSQNGFI